MKSPTSPPHPSYTVLTLTLLIFCFLSHSFPTAALHKTTFPLPGSRHLGEMFNFLKVKHPFTMRLDSHLPHASQNRYAHTLVQSLIIQLVGRLKFSCLAFVRSMALFQPGLSSSQNVASFHVDSPGSTSKESLLRYTNFSIHAAATVIFCNHSHLEFMLSRDNTGNAGQQVKQPWHKKPQSLLLVVLPAFNFTCVKDVSSSLFF